MKIRVPLVVLALAFVSCAVVTPHSFACSTPPRLTITYSWPANFTVGVNSNNVPSGPVSTAMYNWNTGLSAACYAPILVVGPSTLEINMNYGSIPPPSNCSTCVTRGLTNYTGYANGRISGADVTINSVVTDTAAITEVVAHEFGHTFALVDCNYPGCPVYSSVMESGAPVATPNQTIGASGPTSCDVNAVLSVATDYGCPPPPPPPRCCKCGYPNTSKGKQLYNDFAFRKVLQDGTGADGCEIGWSTTCCGSSPIIIDTTGNGFVLTSAANGVKFDITGKGVLDQVAWTSPGSGNAFLCLPDGNGACNSGRYLFGSATPQPPSQTPNGFAALAVYDQPANGGNGDGIIDSGDAIFSSLRLWVDANHDGISQPNELYPLPSLSVNSISLNYKLDSRTDQYGNIFRYRAQVNPGGAPGLGRMAYDVFFVIQHSDGTTVTAKSCPAANPQAQDAPKDTLRNNRRR